MVQVYLLRLQSLVVQSLLELGDGTEYGMTVSGVGSAATGGEDHIVLEEATQIEQNDSYHGTKIVLEDATFNDIATNQSASSGQPHFTAYGFHNVMELQMNVVLLQT